MTRRERRDLPWDLAGFALALIVIIVGLVGVQAAP